VGVCYEKMDKPNVARPYYQATTELAPQAPDGWFGLAICALMTDEHLQAIDYLNKAIALDDTNPDFWYNLGDAYYQADNIPQATDAFVRALAAEPTHLEARIDLAFALSENDDAKAAIELFEKGMDFHSENSEYLYCYAALLIEAGKQQQGYLYLQTALQINYPQYVILLEIAPEILLDPQVVAIIQDNKPE
jgi:tetratricopeptide (TPR) repeat protein